MIPIDIPAPLLFSRASFSSTEERNKELELQFLFDQAWKYRGSIKCFSSFHTHSDYIKKFSGIFIGLNINLLDRQQTLCLELLTNILDKDPEQPQPRFLRAKLNFKGKNIHLAHDDFLHLKNTGFIHRHLNLYLAYIKYLLIAEKRQREIDDTTLDKKPLFTALPTFKQITCREIGHKILKIRPLNIEFEEIIPLLDQSIEEDPQNEFSYLLKAWIQLILSPSDQRENVLNTIDTGYQLCRPSTSLFLLNCFVNIENERDDTPKQNYFDKIQTFYDLSSSQTLFYRILYRTHTSSSSEVILLVDQAKFLFKLGNFSEGALRWQKAINLDPDRNIFLLDSNNPNTRLIFTLDIGYNLFRVWLKSSESQEAKFLLQTLQASLFEIGQKIVSEESTEWLKEIYNNRKNPNYEHLFRALVHFIKRYDNDLFEWEPQWLAKVNAQIKIYIGSEGVFE